MTLYDKQENKKVRRSLAHRFGGKSRVGGSGIRHPYPRPYMHGLDFAKSYGTTETPKASRFGFGPESGPGAKNSGVPETAKATPFWKETDPEAKCSLAQSQFLPRTTKASRFPLSPATAVVPPVTQTPRETVNQGRRTIPARPKAPPSARIVRRTPEPLKPPRSRRAPNHKESWGWDD